MRILSQLHFILRSPKNVSQILNRASFGLISSPLELLIAGFVLQLLLIFNSMCKKQLTWQSLRTELWTDSYKHLTTDPDLSFTMTAASTQISVAASVYGVSQCGRRWSCEGVELGSSMSRVWWPEQPVPRVSCQHFGAQPLELFHSSFVALKGSSSRGMSICHKLSLSIWTWWALLSWSVLCFLFIVPCFFVCDSVSAPVLSFLMALFLCTLTFFCFTHH